MRGERGNIPGLEIGQVYNTKKKAMGCFKSQAENNLWGDEDTIYYTGTDTPHGHGGEIPASDWQRFRPTASWRWRRT